MKIAKSELKAWAKDNMKGGGGLYIPVLHP